MILVDSCGRIDVFRGIAIPQTDRLDIHPGGEPVAIGDITSVEVLQGFTRERDRHPPRRPLHHSHSIVPGGFEVTS